MNPLQNEIFNHEHKNYIPQVFNFMRLRYFLYFQEFTKKVCLYGGLLDLCFLNRYFTFFFTIMALHSLFFYIIFIKNKLY